MKFLLCLLSAIFTAALSLHAIEEDPDLIWVKYDLSYDFKYVKFSPDEKFIVAKSGSQTIFFDPANGDTLKVWNESEFRFSKDGSLMVSFSGWPAELGNRFIIRSYPSLDTLKILPADAYDYESDWKLSPDNTHLALAKGYKLAILDWKTGEERIIYDKLLKYGDDYFPAKIGAWDFNVDGSEMALIVTYTIPPHYEKYNGDFIYDLKGDSVKQIIGQSSSLRYACGGKILILSSDSIKLLDAVSLKPLDKPGIHEPFMITKDEKYLIEGGYYLDVSDYSSLKLLRAFQHPNPNPNPPLAGKPVPLTRFDISLENDRIIVANSSMIMMFNLSSTRIKEKKGKELNLYPNPAGTSVTIPLNLKAGNLQINIMDMAGKIFQKLNMGFYNPGIHKILLDISELHSGIYFISAVCGNEVQNFKLIKE